MPHFHLDAPLLQITSGKHTTHWTVRDAVEGVQIFGGIGSGKTSGSGRMLALKYLKHGFGGLVLTVKPDEKDLWQDYCRQAGRVNDLVILEPGGKERFNFVEYISEANGSGNAYTENIVQVLKTVIRASEEKGGGRGDDAFWEASLDMLIFHAIDLCYLAYGKVSIQQLYDIAITAPRKPEEGVEPKKKTEDKAFDVAYQKVNDEMKDLSYAFLNNMTYVQRCEYQASPDRSLYVLDKLPELRLFKFVDQFFFETYYNLHEKTRSIIEFSFASFLLRMLKEPIYSLFCNGQSTIRPEDCLEGKIILINLPVKVYHKVGRDCQVLFKYIWQRTMEKRNVKLNQRPMFLWADEAQNFLHEHDPDYQATARSSMIATVYISQNLPNYHANMGGVKSEYKVKSFLGTLGTKIFHANADLETNKYASELVGKSWTEEKTKSFTLAGQFSSSRSMKDLLLHMMRPEQFVSLKTGGPENEGVTEGLMHRQGKKLQPKFNHKVVEFSQDYQV